MTFVPAAVPSLDQTVSARGVVAQEVQLPTHVHQVVGIDSSGAVLRSRQRDSSGDSSVGSPELQV